MSAALGFLGIWIAILSSAYLAARGLLGLFRPDPSTPLKLGLPVLGVFGGGLLAMLALEMALLADDFTVSYVANHSASSTPFLYKVASAWAALEGSLVLWALVLAAFILFVWIGHRRKGDADPLGAGALGVMGVVALFFFVMLGTASNPFEICTVPGVQGCAASSALPWSTGLAPLEGLGPNPLLQNHPLMAVHPPMLYIGYVGLTVPFAFALAALLRAESGPGWLRRTQSWTRIAWVFLTAGIVLGGLWSYEVLGWGGYWAWDPVENASFWPWLIATAFLHSASLQMRRGVLQAWSYILVIAAFSSTILGTFLTRSGVIVSVHSFSQSPIGPALLWFLMFILVAALGLFAARIHLVGSSPRLDSVASREGVFLINNLLLTVFALVVLVGTLYPMLWEALRGQEVGVGRPFYDRIAIPLSLLLIGAMGIGAIAPYRVARGRIVWERMRSPLRFGLAVGALAVLLGQRNGWTLVVSVLAGFIALAAPCRTHSLPDCASAMQIPTSTPPRGARRRRPRMRFRRRRASAVSSNGGTRVLALGSGSGSGSGSGWLFGSVSRGSVCGVGREASSRASSPIRGRRDRVVSSARRSSGWAPPSTGKVSAHTKSRHPMSAGVSKKRSCGRKRLTWRVGSKRRAWRQAALDRNEGPRTNREECRHCAPPGLEALSGQTQGERLNV